ncbi:LuxR C-terminal-related transcriptional regulator [Fodinicola acaciae]|uniref:LuxR C-terminal-related transcriptional regulator n=1 Tax=Fodinicola acaciae TaxID=2681555 RepID=UPI0013D8DD7C|nr:LuxR C-terminal-related transcriptional regulator [Fodinicola acaciae]
MDVSKREAEVLGALGAGLTNTQIANRLHISVRTVEGHVSSLLRKLGVTDRSALGALAGTTTDLAPLGRIACLPVSRTTFVGRRVERETVASALASGGVVTLVGPGGVGKTRLAAVVAQASNVAFGGAFVDLVPVGADSLVPAVAAALGVVERAYQPLEAAVLDRLGRGPSLLVLDNCEHLSAVVATFVDRVLAACPETAVLATSRERLGVPGERTVALRPLPVGSDAERLFLDRAHSVDPDFGAEPGVIAELCARLDGMPLAIELAAARSGALGAAGLLAGLGDQLRLLAGGRGTVVRHRSLRAVVDWSHDLLDDDERTVFRRLGIFAGHFDLHAAACVGGGDIGDVAVAADVLGRLVDKSMVLRQPGEPVRWRMLEAMRAYARERLEEGDDRDATRRRYLEWAAAVSDSPDELRAALAIAMRTRDPIAPRIARSLARLCFARRFVHEALEHFRTAAADAADAAESARDLASAADCALVVDDTERAFELRLASAAAAEKAGIGDAQAIALARAVEMAARYPVTFRTEVSHERLVELLADARAAGDTGDPLVAGWISGASAWIATPEKLSPDPALAAAAVTAAEATGDPVLLSAALDAVRTVAIGAGRPAEAHAVTRRRVALTAQMNRDDPYAAAEIEDSVGLAGLDAVAAGDLPTAMDMVDLVLSDEPAALSYLAASKILPTVVLAGDLDRAGLFADQMWHGWQRAGRPPAFWMQVSVHFAALAHGLRADREGCDRWCARGRELAATPYPFQSRLLPLATYVQARTALQLGDFDQARALVSQLSDGQAPGRYLPYACAAAAELAVTAGLPEAAGLLADARPYAVDNAWNTAVLARTTGRLHGDRALLRKAAGQWEAMGARFEHAYTLTLL